MNAVLDKNIKAVFENQADRGNVKFSRALRRGVDISLLKLGDDILSAPDIDSEVKVINNWIASDGRSIRTLAYVSVSYTHLRAHETYATISEDNNS